MRESVEEVGFELFEEYKLHLKRIENWISCGVKIHNPFSVIVEDNVILETGCEIGAFSIIKKGTIVKRGAKIREHCYIENSKIGEDSVVWNSTIVDSEIGESAYIGPYSYLRGNTIICNSAQVGSYCEINNTVFGDGSKSKHFSYIGHANVGKNVNIGAGTITCTYDGKNKNRTKIDDGSFVGSGTMIVAPISIGEKSYIGAGSIVTKDIDSNTLVYGSPARRVRSFTENKLKEE